MQTINNYDFHIEEQLNLSGNQNDLLINSNYIGFVTTSPIEITGIESPAETDSIAIIFLKNSGQFDIKLKAKSPLSLPKNQFQIDNDITIKSGDIAVFVINENGLFSYGVLKDNYKYYYSVRNADPIDVAAAEEVVYDSVPIIGFLNYKILKFSQPHTFQGTETWVKQMTSRQVVNNLYNPLYFDLTLINAFEVGRGLVPAALDNIKFINSLCIEAAAGNLFKNALTWTSAEKLAFNVYWNKIRYYGQLGNVGEVLAQLQADLVTINTPAVVQALDPNTGITHNVTVLTAAMLQNAIDNCIEYKKLYPDGTV